MKRKPYSRRKRTTTKSVLRLPDLEHAKAAVLNSLTSLDAQRGIVTPSMNSLTGIVRARMTGNSDRTAATFTQSLIGGMEAIDHEAETLLTKKTHHHKICPAPARPRARQSRSLE